MRQVVQADSDHTKYGSWAGTGKSLRQMIKPASGTQIPDAMSRCL